MTSQYPSVEVREGLSSEEFFHHYVARGRPVVIRNLLRDWPALEKWRPDYFRQVAGKHTVRIKDGYIASRKVFEMQLSDYLDVVEKAAENWHPGAPPAPYLHDLPLLGMVPDLRHDLEPFPRDFFSPLYRPRWWEFTQFFLGPKGSLTPLHFDCLKTQNLFFQVHGHKRWILIPEEQAKHCYVYDWRWSQVDAENPDYDRFPEFRKASPVECTIGPGDMIYLPPGTLHQVRGLDVSISFNIDWHTRTSAVRGVLAAAQGMPLTNVRYNLAMAVGLCSGLPYEAVKPFYRSYLNYFS